MKLRIRGHSVRIRLARTEVMRLGQGLPVEQVTQFSPAAVFRSSVQPQDGVSRPVAELSPSSIRVLMPIAQLRDWAHSNEVAIEAHQDAGDDVSLQILIEKDFACIHSRAEGNDDAFPNPREAQECASS